MKTPLKYLYTHITDFPVGVGDYESCPSYSRVTWVLCRIPGWSGGAMVLGKLPTPGRPTNLDYSRARAYCAWSGCGWELFGHSLSLSGRRPDID